MTEFIKLPCGKWINPAHISEAIVDGDSIEVWLVGDHRTQPTGKYRGEDATALTAALDAMSIKEGM